jgi:FSR family fosmidomycin resistance protein-like MFS transporter
MSMPSTLYLLGKHMPDMLGFSFGLLTFGLFLGFLPVYGELKLPIGPQLACAAGSVLSAALMLLAWKAVDRDRISA